MGTIIPTLPSPQGLSVQFRRFCQLSHSWYLLSEFIIAFSHRKLGRGKDIISEQLYSIVRGQSGKGGSCGRRAGSPCFYFHRALGLSILFSLKSIQLGLGTWGGCSRDHPPSCGHMLSRCDPLSLGLVTHIRRGWISGPLCLFLCWAPLEVISSLPLGKFTGNAGYVEDIAEERPPSGRRACPLSFSLFQAWGFWDDFVTRSSVSHSAF